MGGADRLVAGFSDAGPAMSLWIPTTRRRRGRSRPRQGHPAARNNPCRPLGAPPELPGVGAAPSRPSVTVRADQRQNLHASSRNRGSGAPHGRRRPRSEGPPGRSPRRTPRPSWPGRTPQSFDSRSTHSWGQVCGHLGAAWWTEPGRTGVPARCPPHTPDDPRIRARPDHALHTSPGRPTSTDTGAPQRPQDLLSLLFFFSSENYRRPGLGNVRAPSPAQGRSVGPPCQALP